MFSVLPAARPRALLWFLLFVLPASHALAQADFQPGYLIKTGPDTIRGLIDYRSIAFNARHCHFRPDSRSPTQEYGAADVRAYGLAAGPHYEAHKVLRADSTTGSFFLEVVERGPVSLLFLFEANRQRFFLKKADGSLAELVQTSSTLYQDGRRYKQVRKPYLGELAVAFDACPAERAAVQKVEFKRSALAQAVRRYNECATGQKIATPRRAGAGQLTVLLGAVAWHDLTLWTGNGVSEFDDHYGGKGFIPALGVQFRSPTFFSRRLAVVLGAFYQPGYHYQVTDKVYPDYAGLLGERRRTSVELKLDYLHIPALLRYTAPLGRTRLFAEAGPSVRLVLRTARNEVVRRYASGGADREPLYRNGPRPFNVCLAGGLGAEFGQGRHRPSLSLRFETGPGSSPYLTGSRQRVISVLVGYPLN